MSKVLRIGSRGSKLALWQANFVQSELKKAGYDSTIEIIKTKGDKIQNLSFDKIEGKGFFTKEIEDALLNKTVDIAVHSHKDLETTQPEGLKIAAVSKRAALEDVLLIHPNAAAPDALFKLKQDAVVGTSSARRKAQILSFRNDLQIKDLRGNVPTRIDKLRGGAYDAIILAAAGIERLQLDVSDLVVHHFDPKKFIPAPAQGVLGIQVRSDDSTTTQIVEKTLHHSDVSTCITAERSVLKGLNGGCQLPLGTYCYPSEQHFTMHIAYAPNAQEKMKFFTLTNDSPKKLVEEALAILQ